MVFGCRAVPQTNVEGTFGVCSAGCDDLQSLFPEVSTAFDDRLRSFSGSGSGFDECQKRCPPARCASDECRNLISTSGRCLLQSAKPLHGCEQCVCTSQAPAPHTQDVGPALISAEFRVSANTTKRNKKSIINHRKG